MKVLRIKIKFKIQNNKNEINTVNYFLLGALKVHNFKNFERILHYTILRTVPFFHRTCKNCVHNFNNFGRILHYATLRTIPFFHRTCKNYVTLNRRLWVIILLPWN